MVVTTFWSADGRPMSAAQFLESLFGALPEFFKNEAELRAIWSKPDTRKAFLAGLADKGYGKDNPTTWPTTKLRDPQEAAPIP